MTKARESQEFEALVAAAGLKPTAADLEELRAAYSSLAHMKRRVRAALRWHGEPAHVFAPPIDKGAIDRTPGAMDTIPIPPDVGQ